MKLTCSVTTPERLVHETGARFVVVPAIDGELGILPRHAPLTALLGTGELRVQGEGGEKESIFVRGGFVQVVANSINVLATEAERADEIDREAAQRDLEAARAESRVGLSSDQLAEQRERIRAANVRARIATGSGDAED